MLSVSVAAGDVAEREEPPYFSEDTLPWVCNPWRSGRISGNPDSRGIPRIGPRTPVEDGTVLLRTVCASSPETPSSIW